MKFIRNPILRGFNPDPSIVRVGDDYYIATSTFGWLRAFMSIWPALKPEMDQRYWHALQRGDSNTAIEVVLKDWAMLDPSSKYPGGWQSVCRGWCELRGVARRYLRAPLRSFNEEEMERLKSDLRNLGAL